MRKLKHIKFALAVWAVIVGGGVFLLAKYAATPGATGPTIASASAPQTDDMRTGQMTLLMFVHPKCPCTDASIEELSKLMSQCGDRLSAQVNMLQPSEEAADWSHTASWDQASKIPGVVVNADVDAKLAKKCGAQTSGQVLLYDKVGRLVFNGGITASRGHVGDNDGADLIAKIVLGKIPPGSTPKHTPVFGCAIYASSSDSTTNSANSVKQ